MFLGEQKRLYLLFETSWYLNMTAKQIVLQCSRSRFEFLVSRSYKGLQSTRDFGGDSSQPAFWVSRGRVPFAKQVSMSHTVGKWHSAPERKTTQTRPSKRENKKMLLTAQPRSNCHLAPTSSAHGVCGEHGHGGAGNVLQQTIAKLLRSAIKNLAWQPP